MWAWAWAWACVRVRTPCYSHAFTHLVARGCACKHAWAQVWPGSADSRRRDSCLARLSASATLERSRRRQWQVLSGESWRRAVNTHHPWRVFDECCTKAMYKIQGACGSRGGALKDSSRRAIISGLDWDTITEPLSHHTESKALLIKKAFMQKSSLMALRGVLLPY